MKKPVVVPCGHCGKPRDPELDFTKRTVATCTKVLANGETKTYSAQHPKQRSYECKECCRDRMRKLREARRGDNQRPSMQGRERCCHHGCERWAEFRDPIRGAAWRACADHALPGDEPIVGAE